MSGSPTGWFVFVGLVYAFGLVIPIAWERIRARRRKLHELRSAYDDAVHRMLRHPEDPAARASALEAASSYYDAALSRRAGKHGGR